MSYETGGPNDFIHLQKQVGKWANKNFGEIPSWQPLLGVQEEAGELEEVVDTTGLPRLVSALYHAYLKRKQGIRGTHAENTAMIADAIGDITIYLLDFCEREEISFDDVVWDTWSKVSRRDWKIFPLNGVSQ